LRIPTFKKADIVLVLAALAFPLIWWGPPLLVVLGAAFCLAALFAASAARSPEPESKPAVSPPVEASSPHSIAAAIIAASLALMAFLSGISEPVLAAKIALSSLLVSRALFLIDLARFGELARLAMPHAGALLATLIMVEPANVLTCVLWQLAWLAVDGSRLRIVAAPAAPAEAASGASPVASVAEASVADSIENPASAAAPPAAAVAETAESPAAETIAPAPSSEPSAVPPTAAQSRPRHPAGFLEWAGAWAASLVVVFLISYALVETIAPPADREVVDREEPEFTPEFGNLWRQAPWRDSPAPPPPYGSREWACAQAERLAEHGLHTLTAGVNEQSEDWWPAVQHFTAPALATAPDEIADRVFGMECRAAPNVRTMRTNQLRAAQGFYGHLPSGEIMTIGAVHALDLPDGRRLLLARGWTDEGDAAPTHLLMAWSTGNTTGETPWLVASKGSTGVGGVLFEPARQPLGGYHLWYGAMSPDGERSMSSADIIDVSGSVPRSTGPITIWGASTCGQVPGDLLYPAEENCTQQPAWSFWLTDFEYAPGGADEVTLTWRVRRQFGEAGEPATYDEPFEDTMRGRFVLTAGRWRFMDGEGPLIDDAEFLLALN
jgi:hypothetical protein